MLIHEILRLEDTLQKRIPPSAKSAVEIIAQVSRKLGQTLAIMYMFGDYVVYAASPSPESRKAILTLDRVNSDMAMTKLYDALLEVEPGELPKWKLPEQVFWGGIKEWMSSGDDVLDPMSMMVTNSPETGMEASSPKPQTASISSNEPCGFKSITIIGAEMSVGWCVLNAIFQREQKSGVSISVTLLFRHMMLLRAQLTFADLAKAHNNLNIVAVNSFTSCEELVRTLEGEDALVSCIDDFTDTAEKAIGNACVATGVKRLVPSDFWYGRLAP